MGGGFAEPTTPAGRWVPQSLHPPYKTSQPSKATLTFSCDKALVKLQWGFGSSGPEVPMLVECGTKCCGDVWSHTADYRVQSGRTSALHSTGPTVRFRAIHSPCRWPGKCTQVFGGGGILMGWPGFVRGLLLADARIGDMQESKTDSLVHHNAAC